MNPDDVTDEPDRQETGEQPTAPHAATLKPAALPPPLLAIPGFGEPTGAAGGEPPIAAGTLPAPDLSDGLRTQSIHPRDDADRVRGKIVSESIAQHADHLIGSRLGPLMERAVRVRTLDEDLIAANAAAENIATARSDAPQQPPPETMRGSM